MLLLLLLWGFLLLLFIYFFKIRNRFVGRMGDVREVGRIEIEGNGEEKRKKKTIEHEGNWLGLKARPRPRPLTPGKNVDKTHKIARFLKQNRTRNTQ